MVFLLMALALAAPPFWESKPPGQWSEEELRQMFVDSPWAQASEDPSGQSGAVRAYLATARPMRDAEREVHRRRPSDEDAIWEEYLEFLREGEGKQIVLAVRLPNPQVLADAAEVRRMEEESLLKVGRKKYKLTGHFPPSRSDPWLRLVFPRAAGPADKGFAFELYLPSVTPPYRTVEFRTRELMYKGRPEM